MDPPEVANELKHVLKVVADVAADRVVTKSVSCYR